MTVAVAGHRERVDRIHLVAGRDQRLNPQAAVGFDADHDIAGFFSVSSHQLVEPADTGQSFRQPPRGQPSAVGVHQINVVVVFGPVVSNE